MNISIFSQSLDNASDDLFYDGLNSISQKEGEQRSEISAAISAISLRGKSLELAKDIKVIISASDFLIEIPSLSEDSANRKTSVVCVLRQLSPNFDQNLVLHTIKNAFQHSSKILSPQHQKALETQILPKIADLSKPPLNLQLIALWVGVAAVVLILLRKL